jgi:hypothetical protein
MSNNKFWLDDYKVFYEASRYLYFFPSKTMSRMEQLNAISRFGFYLLILLLLTSDKQEWLFIPFFLITISIVLYFIEKVSKKEKKIKKKCKRPTKQNPFMNTLMTLDDENNSIPACDINDEEIKTEIKEEFNRDLYRNIDDLFERKNSDRQFYTLPVTTDPSDRDKFINWLYKKPRTCKEDGLQCLEYEDIRYH